MKNSSYEGLQEDIKGLRTPAIEVFRNKYPDKDYTINLETAEFTCVCPKTGLPDFAAVVIKYIPDKLCVELKSFKLYIYSYRNIGIFHENAANKILDDFIAVTKPRRADITVIFNLRGGIKTTITRQYEKNKSKRNRK
ncbi:MAG: NADPH-dependent 7-cyano-7-deazaguanine reductase QueF [Candidatus Omnitrophica bacterium]|nr:NADPH-dependent 7-cyano-7-deazaguanine reductase QueF [Candidatus Omnitrophota bacterium]